MQLPEWQTIDPNSSWRYIGTTFQRPDLLQALADELDRSDSDHGDQDGTVVYAEGDVIAARLANLRALEYPPERLEVIVACDGSPDATAQRAREAKADAEEKLAKLYRERNAGRKSCCACTAAGGVRGHCAVCLGSGFEPVVAP